MGQYKLERRFFQFITISAGVLNYSDPDVEPQYFPFDASDKILGESLRISLSKSKEVDVREFQKIFHSGVVQKNTKEREQYVMNKYGYKTRKALYKKMDTCAISAFNDYIEIQPTHQDSLDGWTVKKDMGLTPLQIPHTATDEELGAALRHAFTLCTSAIR
ncbi:contact-dependent growth inhibition system immunity protein [Comamonas testosteroni]